MLQRRFVLDEDQYAVHAFVGNRIDTLRSKFFELPPAFPIERLDFQADAQPIKGDQMTVVLFLQGVGQIRQPAFRDVANCKTWILQAASTRAIKSWK